MASQSSYDVSQDTIFVSGLPEDTTEDQLKNYFGQIGIIKFDKKNNCPKIWIYKDKASGKSKGEATITYDDPPTASAAISWFDGKEFRGAKIKIELAQRKSAPAQFSRGGRGGGRGGGGGGFRSEGGRPAGGGRPGDWSCPSCNNNNFAYRQECNRCHTQKPPQEGGGGGGGGGGSHNNGTRYHDDNNQRGSGGYSSSFRGGGSRGSSSSFHRSNDRYQDRGGANYDRGDGDRHRDRDRDRDRDRGGGGGGGDRDRDRNRSSGHGYSGGSGPSRSHMSRGRDDRRSRPY